MSPPPILLAANTSWNIVNFRAGLVKELQRRGFEVLVAAPEDIFTPRLAELGCRHIRLAMDNKGASPIADAALLVRFLRIVGRERPVAFLGFTIKPNVYGSMAAQAFGVPVINNISGLGTAFIQVTALTKVVKGLYRLALRRSHTVFFQNPDDRDLFVRDGLVLRQRTALLPGSGIDLNTFNPSPPPSAAGDDIRFLMIARLLWDKGIGEYVEAARLVKRRFPGARFQILGFLGADNRTAVGSDVMQQWTEEGVVEYLGDSDDVRPHIAQADCLVLPSYREGTPRTLLEGAAMARPLVATDVPGCRQVVTHGENGLLCAPRDAGDLAGRLMEIVQKSPAERQAMGEASRRKAEREFDERIVVDRYLETLEGLLARPGERGAVAC